MDLNDLRKKITKNTKLILPVHLYGNPTNVVEIKKIIAHGINKGKKKYFWKREADLPGHNFRMPNHLAALGINQLNKLAKFNKKRRQIAKMYDKFLSKFPDIFTVQKVGKN